jgi:hypothetical protein
MSAATFKDEIVKIGRVRLVGFPGALDRCIIRKIRVQAERLARRIDKIDSEIGFTYPPIEILPVCLLAPWEDSVVFAKKSFRCFEEEGFIVVQVSAPTILAFTREPLDAVLAHEFLHYVQDTISFMSTATREGGSGILISRTEDQHPEYMKSEDSYETLDLQMQAADRDWLPARLLALHRNLSGPNKDLFVKSSMLDAFREWLGKGYPSERFDPDLRYQGPLNLDDAVIDHARYLGLLKSE